MRKLLLISVLALLGCSEEIVPEAFTYSQIISGKESKVWEFRELKSWIENRSETNFSLPPCINDDLYVFYADAEKKYEVLNGSSKCASDEPDVVVSDIWSFTNAGATLNIIIPFLSDGTLPFIVREINQSTMVLEIFRDQENTASYRITFEAVEEN
jgi:hypothetical protein